MKRLTIPTKFEENSVTLNMFEGDVAPEGVSFSIGSVMVHCDEVRLRYSPRPQLAVQRDGVTVFDVYVPRYTLRRIAVEVGRHESPSHVTEVGRE